MDVSDVVLTGNRYLWGKLDRNLEGRGGILTSVGMPLAP